MNPFISAVEAAWAALKADIIAAETWLVSLVKQLWTTDEQIIMADLQKALNTVAVNLQNQQPGISSKAMAAELIAAVAGEFINLGAQLVYADILIVVAAVVKSTNAPELPGNAGNLPGGNSNVTTTTTTTTSSAS